MSLEEELCEGIDLDALSPIGAEAFLEFEAQLREAVVEYLEVNSIKETGRVWAKYLQILNIVGQEFEYDFSLSVVDLHEYQGVQADHEVVLLLEKVDSARFRAALKISKLGRDRVRSVALSLPVKQQIRELIRKIRSKLDEVDVPRRKRESLLAALSRFETEIDRDTTQLECFSEIVLDVADTGTEFAKRVSGIRKLVKVLEKILGAAKEDEGVKRLGHEEMRQIEGKSDAIDGENDDDE